MKPKSKAKPRSKVTSTTEALVAALVDDPDDIATYGVYADWLMEQGDPRGEFMQVQIALEKPKLTADERKRLRKREIDLLTKHRNAWLGDLAGFAAADGVSHEFRRGWLDTLHVRAMDADLASMLVEATQHAPPETRLLRRLIIADREAEPFDRLEARQAGELLAGPIFIGGDFEENLEPLLDWSLLGNLRAFQLGDVEHGQSMVDPVIIPDLVARMPRLESLHLFPLDLDTEKLFGLKTLGNLRELKLAGIFRHELEILGKNKRLGPLTHLYLEGLSPIGYSSLALSGTDTSKLLKRLKDSLTHLALRNVFACEFLCTDLVETGVLKRLKVLDLSYGDLNDDHVVSLAECPDLAGLERLDVSYNVLTKEGRKRLREACPHVIDQPQREPEE